MTTHSKTLLVGLDAACWEYLDPLLTAGRLPTLQRLMEAGAWGRLDSTMPPLTPAAWASIITGKNPGKHGIFDMLWRRPGTYQFEPMAGQYRAGTPFWQYLNRYGLRVGLVNVPFTYPPEPLEGFVVPGFGAPNSTYEIAFPPSAQAWIRSHHPDFTPNVDAGLLQGGSPHQVLAAEAHHQSLLVDIAVGLSRQSPVDVLAINLMLLDHANHKLPDMALVEEAIVRCDADLDRLIAGFAPETILLISDHGSRRVKGNFLLHAWLHDQGYLTPALRPATEQAQILNWVLLQWLQTGHGWSGSSEKLARGVLRRTLRSAFPRLPAWIEALVWQAIERKIPFARSAVQYDGVPDYRQSRLFPAAIYSGLLYFNQIGREPDGALAASDRPALTAELSERLGRILDPDTGRPIISAVHTAADIYTGPAAGAAPDLLLDHYESDWNLQARSYTPSVEPARTRYFVGDQGNYGWHSREGVFIFCGPGFLPGQAARSGHVQDIPATLLYLCGTPIPDDYDGRVLTDLLRLDFVLPRPVAFQPGDPALPAPDGAGLSQAESELIADQLRALGYLE